MMKYGHISFDMDSWWALLDIKNKRISKKKDFLIKKSVPRIRKLLNKYHIKATFFVLGPDVESFPKLYKNLITDGHEIANHTYCHFHNLKDRPLSVIRREIKKNHDVIKDKLKVIPIGFRAPNYSFNEKVLRVLEETKYKYDSSLSPSFYPLAFPLAWLRMPKESYFPSRKNILRKGGSPVLEIPLSTSHLFRLPLIGTSIRILGQWFLRLSLSNLTNININFHARDFVPEIPYERGLPLMVYTNLKDTIQRMDEALKFLSQKVKLITLGEYSTKFISAKKYKESI
ncbi:polysaccharide deacetylase family protein [Candidatus Woesearchaeota archaeon]|nr:polysaccharide deacetylase family protein [Candidatus Woesearchaeota archaeon]